ncbi:DUF11 domain-containing protein [Buchananella hordeovulneris]|nr:DUF11 domain-containing protein [Buchananella hordeovulneris]
MRRSAEKLISRLWKSCECAVPQLVWELGRERGRRMRRPSRKGGWLGAFVASGSAVALIFGISSTATAGGESAPALQSAFTQSLARLADDNIAIGDPAPLAGPVPVEGAATAEPTAAPAPQAPESQSPAPITEDTAAPAEDGEPEGEEGQGDPEAEETSAPPAEESPAPEEEDEQADPADTETSAPSQLQPRSSRSAALEPKAQAGDLALSVKVHTDGTAGFNDDDNPGNDSGNKNGIVRVNDTVTYELEYVVRTGVAENLTYSITFPKGMEITEVPGYCAGPGSQITPSSAGNPRLPLTGDSINELAEQTLTCNVGRKEAATEKVYVTAKVTNLVKQGQELAPVAATVTATGVDAPVAAPDLPSVRASARLMWDISKNSTALTPDSGYKYGPAFAPCLWDNTQQCFVTGYQITIFAPANGKGAMPATGDVTFVDDLSPEALYPQLTPQQHAQMNANLEKYGSRLYNNQRNYLIPGSKVGTTQNGVTLTPVNAVRDSGRLHLKTDGPGKPVTMTLQGADFSLRTFPTQVARPIGSALPAGQAYAVAHAFDVYTPAAAVRDFGIEDPRALSWSLDTRNAFTKLDITGLTPTDKQTSADQPDWNDYRTTVPVVQIGNAFSKYFAGVPGTERNMAPADFEPGFSWTAEGPPGGATQRSGDITVAPTQEIISVLQTRGSSPLLPAKISMLMCDAWDNSKLHLKEKNYPGSSLAGGQKVPSGGKAVWVSGYNNLANATNTDARDAVSADEVPAIKVQYSAVAGGPGEASRCGDAQGPWFDSPAEVPGNDPDKAARGVYTGVSRVRVTTLLPEPVGNFYQFATGYHMQVSVGLEVADNGHETGTRIPNWASAKRVPFEELDTAGIIAANQGWTPSTYNENTHRGVLGDRLTLAHAQVRIAKAVRKGTTGPFTKTPPNVTGNDTVQYQLSPSLTSAAVTRGVRKDVWVEDCIPASQSYASASVAPNVVQQGSMPADAKRQACGPGETYVRWVLPQQEVNEVIEPIILSVEVDPTVNDGVYTNRVEVWAQDDASTLAQRVDTADVQVANVAGVKLQKLALTPVVQVNRPGPAMFDEHKWRIRLTNTLPTSDATRVENPDIIDVLPRQGLNGTRFSGSFGFVSAEISRGNSQTRLLYTSAADVNNDPRHPSNAADGATTWCDSPFGGVVVSGTGTCPADPNEVTALRVQQSGVYPSGSVIEVDLSMIGVDNVPAEDYVNSVSAAADGLKFTIGPLLRAETTVASELGDYFWIDANGNGLQDAGELPVADAEVTLQGRDDLGNRVELTTRTDAAGLYKFPNLRASDANGYTVTFRMPGDKAAEMYEFTTTNGGDDMADSDADGAGVAAGIVLPVNTTNHSVDAGIAKPQIDLVKSVDKDVVAPGDQVLYTFTATNNGQVTLHDVKLSEESFTNGRGETIQLDAAPQFQADQSTGTVDEMEVGDKLVWTAPYTVKEGDLLLGTTINNSAKVEGTSPRGQLVNDKDEQRVRPKGSGAFVFSKTADPASDSEVVPGQKVTYTVKIQHRGELALTGAQVVDDLAQVLDDATYNGDVQASSGQAQITGTKLTWNGDLAVGQTVTVTYSVQVGTDGDAALRNTVSTPDDRGQCDDAVGCETQHRIKPGSFVYSKAAAPASGSSVNVGDKIVYTLVVRHADGNSVKGARISDNLARVLDDATYNGDVAASSGTAQVQGEELTWSGDLAPGQRATITFSVTVKQGGNLVLDNSVTSDDNRGKCDVIVGCETTHRIEPGSFVFSKVAEAASGSTVNVGDKIVYTLKVRHAAGNQVPDARISDSLARVLDDATYNGDVAASSGDVRVEGETLTWSGNVGVGEEITITFSVTVKQGGDRTLVNTVTSDHERGKCDDAVGCETTHRITPPPTPTPTPTPSQTVVPSPIPSVTPTPTPSTPQTTPPAKPGGRLPKTGADAIGVGSIAGIILVGGLALVGLSRRRRAS